MKSKIYNKSGQNLAIVWARGYRSPGVEIVGFPFKKHQVQDVRCLICNRCGSELLRFSQNIVHPATENICTRWELSSWLVPLCGDEPMYLMGGVKMEDLEPYAYRWRFVKS